jgi:signal transduction histidine kinase
MKPASQPAIPADEVGRDLSAAALGAWLVGCGVPLAQGIVEGWPAWRLGAYVALALAALVLFVAYQLPEPFCRLLTGSTPVYLALHALVGLGLQATSGDPFVQPIVFCVPLVHASLAYPAGRTAAIGALYLGTTALGLWLAGQREPQAFFFPVAAYGALMLLLDSFVRSSVRQAEARARADALAAELGHERDRLAKLAAENARLAEQARHAATLAERNRLARELHDTIAQGLTATTMQIEAAQRAFDRDHERARTRLARAHELARATLADVRRSVWALAEPLVDGPGLPDALDDLVRRFAERAGVAATFQHTGPPPPLGAEAADQVLRVAQESLTNVEKHAAATEVWVELVVDEREVRLSVHDNGDGFDPQTHAPHANGGGFGLLSQRERARLAGGALMVESAPGQGTCVTMTIATAGGTNEEDEHECGADPRHSG